MFRDKVLQGCIVTGIKSTGIKCSGINMSGIKCSGIKSLGINNKSIEILIIRGKTKTDTHRLGLILDIYKHTRGDKILPVRGKTDTHKLGPIQDIYKQTRGDEIPAIRARQTKADCGNTSCIFSCIIANDFVLSGFLVCLCPSAS
jgi:hypothetical protein